MTVTAAARPPSGEKHPTDKHVGARVRMRRMMLGMSQTKLGDALGLTFQQIQKYEKGINRIGAGRMMQIAGILKMPVSWFFEGHYRLDESLSDPDGVRLVTAFARIKRAGVRRELVQLIEHLSRKEHKSG